MSGQVVCGRKPTAETSPPWLRLLSEHRGVTLVKKRKESTKRADLLLRTLDCINSGEYDDQDDYMLFGRSDIYEVVDDLTDRDAAHNPDRQSLRELASDLKTHRGREHAARRTSLSKPNQPKELRGLDKLSDEGLRSLREYAARRKSGQPSGSGERNALDDLDAYYAQEVLRKLPKIVDRASRLDEMSLEGVPANVQRYFEEAHRCYLYGFHVAYAVLCRAILESALKASVDPKGSIERSLPKGRSYFKALVENAKPLQDGHGGKDDRPCAFDVKNAGDWAIHNFERFNQTYGGERLHEVLANTRKVLLDLYTGSR